MDTVRNLAIAVLAALIAWAVVYFVARQNVIVAVVISAIVCVLVIIAAEVVTRMRKRKRPGDGSGGDVTATGKYVQQAAHIGRNARVTQTQNITEPQTRTLEGLDLATCKATLGQHRGTTLSMARLAGDAEAESFANEIGGLLEFTGWTIAAFNTVIPKRALSGVLIQAIGNTQDDNPALKALASCLAAHGFTVAWVFGWAGPDPQVLVGSQ